MNVFRQIIGLSWLAFFGVWLVFAIRNRNSGRRRSPRASAVRLLLVLAIVFAIRFANRFSATPFGNLSVDFAAGGAALSLVGVAFAIWARVSLGRNWGMPMTLHTAPELVTSGPYGYVRHPIYSAMAAMVIGTALVFPPAALWAVGSMVYMVISARREEKDMERRFPDTYPAYKQRSKMFVPFLF